MMMMKGGFFEENGEMGKRRKRERRVLMGR